MKDGFLTTNYMIFLEERKAFKLATDGSYLPCDYNEAFEEYLEEFSEMAERVRTTNYLIFFDLKVASKVVAEGAFLGGDYYEEALDEYGREMFADLPVLEEVI